MQTWHPFKKATDNAQSLSGPRRCCTEPCMSAVLSDYTLISFDLPNEAEALRKAQSIASAAGRDVVVTDEDGCAIATVSPSETCSRQCN